MSCSRTLGTTDSHRGRDRLDSRLGSIRRRRRSFRAKPTTDLVKFLNTVKGATARRIRNEYADKLKTELWGDSFWNDSYCLISTGQVSLDVLKQYVEDQRE